jgi:hypothetical protein
MLFTDNMQWHVYIRRTVMQQFWINPSLCFPFPIIPFSFIFANPSFYLLGEPASSLVVRIPIHSCPWFANNCSPLAASPAPRHPTDQVTYLHRQHQQHQPSRLINFCVIILWMGKTIKPFFYSWWYTNFCRDLLDFIADIIKPLSIK